MSNVIKLTKGYIETMLTIRSQLLLIIVISLILGISDDRFILYGSIMGVSVLVNQVLSYEDISGIDFLIAILPVRKKEYVISRYIGGLIAVIISIIILTITYTVSILLKPDALILDYIYFFMISITVSMTMISALIPINLKWGSQRGRILSTLIIIIPFVLAMSMFETLNPSNTFSIIISNSTILMLIVLLLNVVVLFISYFITVKLYEKKEVKK